MTYRVKVWDLPTRLFHWGLVTLFGLLWWSADSGQLVWHARCGEALLVLVVFRLLWGLAGSQTARFGSFVRGPDAVFAYLRGQAPAAPGHNPLGALMVLTLLAALLVQLLLGLFAADVDGYTFDGPLAHLLAGGLAEQVSEWHGAWFNLLLLLGSVHVLAIVGYRVLRNENLVKAMVTGHKESDEPISVPSFVSPWRALVLLLLSAVLVFGGLAVV